jgi:hypothetical protein
LLMWLGHWCWWLLIVSVGGYFLSGGDGCEWI